jgi:flagellar protein FliO/FliZ
MKTFFLNSLGVLISSLLSWPLLAQTPSEPVGRSSSLDAFSLSNILNMFMGLAIVVALILGLAWILRKYGRLPGNNLVDMKVIGGLSLGTREKAVLIEVENTRLLIGVTPGHIQTLHVLGAQGEHNSAFDKTLQQLQQNNEQKNA